MAPRTTRTRGAGQSVGIPVRRFSPADFRKFALKSEVIRLSVPIAAPKAISQSYSKKRNSAKTKDQVAQNQTIDSHRLAAFTFSTLDWIKSNLDFFDPLRDGNRSVGIHFKAFLELTYLTTMYLRCTTPEADPRIHDFLRFINKVWQRPEYQQTIVRNPDRLPWHVMAYLVLLRSGISDLSYFEVIQRVLDQGYASAFERAPFRLLDFRHLLDSGGFRHNLPSYEELYQNTLLAKIPPIPYLALPDIYCITHTLFYLADLSFRPIDAISDKHLPAIRWLTANLLGMYSRERNYDLVGELLISCLCLRWTPAYVFSIAWNDLFQTQLPDGVIPGPKFSRKEMRQTRDKKNYYFEKNYHPTLVAALAAFLTERWIRIS